MHKQPHILIEQKFTMNKDKLESKLLYTIEPHDKQDMADFYRFRHFMSFIFATATLNSVKKVKHNSTDFNCDFCSQLQSLSNSRCSR